jgi:hypothetical protein
MDPEIDKVRRSDYKIGIGYIEEFKWRCGWMDLDFRVVLFPHET